MYPIYHFVLTIIMSGFLYPIFGWKLVLFWLGSFFIDVDHYWWYVIKFKDISLKNAYVYGKNFDIIDNKLHIFHTVEFWILSLVWAIYSEFGFVVFLGLAYHVVMDLVDSMVWRLISRRALSFFSWCYSPSNSTKVKTG